LSADLGIAQIMLVLQASRMQELWSSAGSIQISKETGKPGNVSVSESLQGDPERVMFEAVRVKLIMQWRPQDDGDASNVKQLRKVVGNEWNQFKRATMWAKAVGVGMPKPFGAHITMPHTMDAGHGATGFNVCPAGFQSCFGPIFAFSPHPSLWNGMFKFCATVSWEYVTCF
jgi:hypothetical protein